MGPYKTKSIKHHNKIKILPDDVKARIANISVPSIMTLYNQEHINNELQKSSKFLPHKL